MITPLVSIIVPIYKTERFLRKCVDSILSQTYTTIEVILVDDGSPDNCGRICEEYAKSDARVKVIHKQNAGLSEARNTGIDTANGKYILFVDSDDYLENQTIEMLIDGASGKRLPVIGYKLLYTNSDKVSVPEQAYGCFETLRSYLLSFHELFATKFNFAWGKLYDFSIIQKHSLRFEKGLSLGEDVIFNLQYYNYCNGFDLIQYNGYVYCQHGSSSLSKVYNPKMLDWNEYAYNSIKDYLNSHNALTPTNYAHFMRNVYGNYAYCFRLIALNKGLSLRDKISSLTKYRSTGIFDESLIVSSNENFYQRALRICINKQLWRCYIFLVKLRNCVR